MVQLRAVLFRETEAVQLAECCEEEMGRLSAELEEAKQTLEQERQLRRTLEAEASVKGARLARLEGGLHLAILSTHSVLPNSLQYTI